MNGEKEEQGGGERSTVKGKIGSGGTFYEKTIYRGAHASIVHNKCHSNDARGFYEEPAIVSLDLHEIDKNIFFPLIINIFAKIKNNCFF